MIAEKRSHTLTVKSGGLKLLLIDPPTNTVLKSHFKNILGNVECGRGGGGYNREELARRGLSQQNCRSRFGNPHRGMFSVDHFFCEIRFR